jgi:hypothetical protein
VQGDDERVAHDPEGWLSVRPTAGGGLLLRGELFGEPAEVLRQALLAESSRQWRTAWVEHDQFGTALPVAGELRARALAELVRRGLGVDQTSTIGPRTDAVVVITVGDESVAERVRALDGEPLPTEVAAVLTCDAGLQALLVGRAGQPLWLGRSHRLATRAQRRALAIRDGGCVFPGCTMPAEWCDVHHEPGWQRGGRTDLDHMVLLCRRHHGAVHGNRWVLRAAGGPASTTGPPEPPQEMVGVEGEGSGVVPPGAVPPGAVPPGGLPPGGVPPGGVPPGGVPPGQRFEWHDRHGHRRLPAQQRGMRPAA